VVGLTVSAASTGFAYFTQYLYATASIQYEPSWDHPYANDRTTWHLRLARALHVFTVGLVVGGYIAFLLGTAWFYGLVKAVV
jgi:hypothetical protein